MKKRNSVFESAGSVHVLPSLKALSVASPEIYSEEAELVSRNIVSSGRVSLKGIIRQGRRLAGEAGQVSTLDEVIALKMLLDLSDRLEVCKKSEHANLFWIY